MKIAVVDHVGNHGGGSRVVRSLLPALKHLEPDLEITYFGNPSSIRRENLAREFAAESIEVRELGALRLTSTPLLRSERLKALIKQAQSRWLKRYSWLPVTVSGNVAYEISRQVRGYDLVFYPWPFLMSFPHVDCPSVGIFHDFNFKYYFGGNFVFSPSQYEQLNQDMPKWLESSTPVVSTQFMADELASFYPEAAQKTQVVHLAPFGNEDLIDPDIARNVVSELNVQTPYILYPTQMCTHKNVGPLIGAIALLNAKGLRTTLVLTGSGTEAVRGYATASGVRLDGHGGDVLGLGYVSNLQIDSLVQCASIVVSSSLYEAGNGPGLDAWGRGTPVAMSDIPPYREHIDTLNVRAKIFDPRCPKDISDKLLAILENPDRAQDDAQHSLHALQSATWEKTAAAYLRIFRNAIEAASEASD